MKGDSLPEKLEWFAKKGLFVNKDERALVESAAEKLKDPDRLVVTRCSECFFWDPDGDEGTCNDPLSPCHGQKTSAMWFCANGERDDSDE